MRWIPHNYQLKALCFLLQNNRSGLFLDPGLGKTSTSLSYMRIAIGDDRCRAFLVIAPLRVIYSTWPEEIDKWDNFNKISYTILHGPNKAERLWGPQKNIYLINPEGLKWLHQELFQGLTAGKKLPFNGLVIDESTKFKNPLSNRFQYMVNMLPLFKLRHIMTGTPVPKSLLDAWGQIYILDEGKSLQKNFYHYRNKYFYTEDWDEYSYIVKDGCDEEIHKRIAPIVLNMNAADHLEIPELVNNKIYVDLPTKAYKNYKKMEKDFFLALDGMEASAKQVAQKSMKCHQIANGQVYEDIPEGLEGAELRAFMRNRKTLHVHKAKEEAILDLYEELNGKPLLIAYHFKHDLEGLRSVFGADLPYIGSGVSPKETKRIVELWNAGKLDVLAGHPTSMAHGLNMQSAGNDIAWYSLTWNAEEYLQFNARIWRQGVRNAVRVHHFIARNTVDEIILDVVTNRKRTQNDLRKAIQRYRKRLKL